jgi:5-formyltetrahydrofolate cyclo-ligase
MAIYSPSKYEIDTVEIFYYLKKRKIDIFYPRVSSDLLEFGLVDKLDDLKKGKFGVREPRSSKNTNIDCIDFFLIPCLAIDLNNKRLGYGRGFYDKTMKNIDSKKTLAILRPKRLMKDFSAEAHDIKIGRVISVQKQNMEGSYELN